MKSHTHDTQSSVVFVQTAVTCTGGRVYKACGPTTELTCASPDTSLENSDKCEEGCYCPQGMRLLGSTCVDPEECPCQLRGRLFQPGQKVPKDCNTWY